MRASTKQMVGKTFCQPRSTIVVAAEELRAERARESRQSELGQLCGFNSAQFSAGRVELGAFCLRDSQFEENLRRNWQTLGKCAPKHTTR